jgi:hypothetical protein
MKSIIYCFFAKLVDVNIPHATAGDSKAKLILNIVFGILGAISVLVITYSGIQFMLSRGAPDKIAQARNTIIYALVGLAIAIFAAVLVNFVIGGVK